MASICRRTLQSIARSFRIYDSRKNILTRLFPLFDRIQDVICLDSFIINSRHHPDHCFLPAPSADWLHSKIVISTDNKFKATSEIKIPVEILTPDSPSLKYSGQSRSIDRLSDTKWKGRFTINNRQCLNPTPDEIQKIDSRLRIVDTIRVGH